MNLRRHAWEEVSGILQRHGGLPDSYWWDFMVETYATTQVMAVRRQADSHRDVVSLAKLLEPIAPDAERITRDFSLGLWKRGDDLDGIDRQMERSGSGTRSTATAARASIRPCRRATSKSSSRPTPRPGVS